MRVQCLFYLRGVFNYENVRAVDLIKAHEIVDHELGAERLAEHAPVHIDARIDIANIIGKIKTLIGSRTHAACTLREGYARAALPVQGLICEHVKRCYRGRKRILRQPRKRQAGDSIRVCIRFGADHDDQ